MAVFTSFQGEPRVFCAGRDQSEDSAELGFCWQGWNCVATLLQSDDTWHPSYDEHLDKVMQKYKND